jgi:UDP:flavonoid glycosyltransferase YjiC (YdhE family)
MRILYGVVGEGMGHATRSKVVCEELVRRGHEVKIVVSGRAFGYLAKSFPDVVEIRGFEIRYEDNGMALDATIAQNVLAAPEMLQANLLGYVARRQGVPLVCIDNQQIIYRCKHPKPITKGAKFDFELTKTFVRAKLPSLDYAFVTTFFEPPIKPKYEDATMLVPPILRDSILKAKTIARAGELFDFDEKTFIEHMATAKAVVANGGFTTLSEAVYLGKPIYSVPVRHQYEQEMNGRYLELLGYGAVHESVDAKSLKRFLADVPRMTARVAKHHQDGNALLFEKLAIVLDRLVRKRDKKRRAEAS